MAWWKNPNKGQTKSSKNNDTSTLFEATVYEIDANKNLYELEFNDGTFVEIILHFDDSEIEVELEDDSEEE